MIETARQAMSDDAPQRRKRNNPRGSEVRCTPITRRRDVAVHDCAVMLRTRRCLACRARAAFG